MLLMIISFIRSIYKSSNIEADNAYEVKIPDLVLLGNDRFLSYLESGMFQLSGDTTSIKVHVTCWDQLHQIVPSHVNNISRSKCLSDSISWEYILKLFENSIHPILCELSTVFYPNAVLQRVAHNILPPTGCILTGSHGTGKTSVMRNIGTYLDLNPQFGVNIVNIDSDVLKTKQLNDIVAYFNDKFLIAKKLAPSLILIDNIDELCSENNVGTYNGFEPSLFIGLQLERMLHDIYFSNREAHNTAYAHFNQMSPKLGVKTIIEDCGINDHVLRIALKNVVYVLATAQTPTSTSHLVSIMPYLRRCYTILPMNPSSRTSALSLCMGKYNIDISHLITPHGGNISHRNSFLKVSEGFTLKDFSNLSREISAQFLSKNVFSKNLSSLVTWDDISIVRESYIPISQTRYGVKANPMEYQSNVLWSHVGGLSSAKQIIKETLQFPTLFKRLYRNSPIRLPRGILLYGPSGVGKVIYGNI